MNRSRDALEAMFRAGLARVGGREAVRLYLETQEPEPPDYLVAVGKAAAMATGALDFYGDALRDGLVISKRGHIDATLKNNAGLRCIESDHPVPSRRSLDAGRALVDYVDERAEKGGRFLFLLSGGASSLVDVLPEGLDLEGVQKVNAALLGGGLDIARMNAVRRAMSCIKGGRLARRLGGNDALSLLISDVPGDDPAVIGSGLLTPVQDELDWNDYPATVRDTLRGIRLPPPADPEDAARVEAHIIARLDDAKKAAAAQAQSADYNAELMPGFMDGDARETGADIGRFLATAAPGVYIWGGETSVVLPDSPGRGGRNQHLALSAACALRGRDDVYVLAAGTDGTDGASDDAGGLVDGATVARGEAAGMDADEYLDRADSGSFLAASGDLVTTGPTGTNVMDLVIGLKVSAPN